MRLLVHQFGVWGLIVCVGKRVDCWCCVSIADALDTPVSRAGFARPPPVWYLKTCKCLRAICSAAKGKASWRSCSTSTMNDTQWL